MQTSGGNVLQMFFF